MNDSVEDIMIPATERVRLSLELTRRCNSSCIHCFAGADRNQDDQIPLKAAREIIQEGALAGYRHLHLTGGEPLLYTGVSQVIEDALDAGYESILLNTNGLLLDRQMCLRLAGYHELTLSISLEPNEAVHDRFRGKGTYRKVLQGLKMALSGGLDIIVFSLVCRSCLTNLPKFVNALSAHFPSIQYLALNRLLQTNSNHIHLRDEYLAPEDFLGLVRMVSLLNGAGRKVVFLNEPLVNVISKRMEMPWVPESKALGSPGDLMVLADLSLVPSHTSQGFCGVYAPGTIERIGSNGLYQHAVAPDRQTCPSCKYFELCHANAMLRPVGMGTDGQGVGLFCKAVMALVDDNSRLRRSC